MYKSGALLRLILIPISLLPINNSFAQSEAEAYSGVTESRLMFQENCEVCHGQDLTGGPQGVSLMVELVHGDSMDEVIASITEGYRETGMPAWQDLLAPIEIRGLAMYILETKENVGYVTSNYDAPMEIPNEVFETSLHNFQLKSIIKDLDPLPFSIAALPDGSLLLTEKTKGLRIISPTGKKSEFISGTPRAYDDIYRLESRIDIERGMGWLFDVAPHPRYEENGWIYLYHSHRCNECNEVSRNEQRAVSMNRLVRGRIKDGAWVDQEIIWQAPFENYFFAGDVGAGGRIAFDSRGHVYFTIGMKCGGLGGGIQDLSTPCGKTHRVNDDGSIPIDNPYVGIANVYESIYTHGHRSPQGLEYDQANGELWGSEHGPRGGDEINRLLPAENYGWPLHSIGLHYDGTRVNGSGLGIAFELADITHPIVDLTPSPAVSSFIINDGDKFPNWHGDFIVGSLKSRSLFRITIENNRFIEKETLFEGVGRIRDVEKGYNGQIYLLFEHNTGGQIVEIIPKDRLPL